MAPSKLDFEQIAKVAEFRGGLGDEGALYWPFQALDEFEKLVRLHLTRQVQTYRPRTAIVEQAAEMSVSDIVDPAEEELFEDDEPGLFDLMEQFDDEIQVVYQVTERISDATKEIGKKMYHRSSEIEEFSSGADSDNRKVAKRLIAQAASDMDQYTHRMGSELPLFRDYLNKGMTALTGDAAMSNYFNSKDGTLDQVRENLDAVRTLRESMQGAESQMLKFETSVRELPRLTTVLNRSKASMVKIIQKLQEELRSSQTLVREAEISYAAILKG